MGLNDGFANIRGQILNMKPRPGLSQIYNMLDQEEIQRLVGVSYRTSLPPATIFQVQGSLIHDSSQVFLAQGNFKKLKCTHCFKLGHTVDRCYKVYGFPPGHPMAKPTQTLGATNLASLNLYPQSGLHFNLDYILHSLQILVVLRLILRFFLSRIWKLS